MSTFNLSLISMIEILNVHAYEYGLTADEYVNGVVRTGRSKYSEDLSLYVALKLAGITR